MNAKCLSPVLVLLLALALAASINAEPVAQAPTATPQPVNLSTRVPGGVPNVAETATRTPTPEGQIFIEARDFANVRAQPDTAAAQLGQIFNGDQYVAVARYFQWIQFVYEPSPTGRAWVFADLVNVTGDAAQLPELTDPGELSPNDDEINAIGTQAAVTLTPGGLLTATADSRFQALGQATLAGPLILPTFTYPPGIVMIPTSAEPLPDATPAPQPSAPAANGALPPLVPVLLIGGLGVLGLLINGLRRRG
jgi:hypothetical protein